ncbi:MAG: hypothetical protein LUC99_01745 [Clostridiales bacterium]|nr:hypothetical protein [Clostridiales bacterium]
MKVLLLVICLPLLVVKCLLGIILYEMKKRINKKLPKIAKQEKENAAG